MAFDIRWYLEGYQLQGLNASWQVKSAKFDMGPIASLGLISRSPIPEAFERRFPFTYCSNLGNKRQTCRHREAYDEKDYENLNERS